MENTEKILKCPECGTFLKIENGKAIKVEWWELLDWRKMITTFERLPIELQDKIASEYPKTYDYHWRSKKTDPSVPEIERKGTMTEG